MLNLSMKLFMCALMFLWVAAPSDSRADRLPPGKWWQMPQVSEKLNLSPEQKKTLDELFTNNRSKLSDLRSDLKKGRSELESAMAKDPLDEAAVMEQFKKLEATRTNIATERFQFILQVRKLLGAERFQTLKTLIKEHRKKGGDGPPNRRDRRGPKPGHHDPDEEPGPDSPDAPRE